MRAPKGFGKNYFSLAAIQASVSQNTLHSQSVRVDTFMHARFTNHNNPCEGDVNDDALIILPSKEAECRSRRQNVKHHTLLITSKGEA